MTLAPSPDRPTISIVTPSFQQGAFLERTIRSVLEQDYPALEYQVLDGGSTDGSAEIISRYADRLAFWRSRPDDGQADAVNEGWQRSTGEILGWLNSDDQYLPGTLRFVGEWFGAHPGAAIMYGRCRFVDPDGRIVGHSGRPFSPLRNALGLQSLPQPSVFLRRRAWQEAGPLDVSLRFAMDYEFFRRVTRIAPPIFVARELSAATVHAAAKTTDQRAAVAGETLQVAGRYASPVERVLLVPIGVGAWVYHHQPRRLRDRFDRLRRHRTVSLQGAAGVTGPPAPPGGRDPRHRGETP